MLRIPKNRLFSGATTSVSYNRKGNQPAVASVAIKTHSKTTAGVSVMTLDSHGPAASVAVYLKAGTRYDSSDKPGVAHLFNRSVMRNVPGDSLTRTILDTELRGNSLYSTVSREHISIGSEFLRDDLVDVVPALFSNLFNKSFEVYEFIEAMNAVSAQTAASLADPSTVVMDKLHQIAFRTGLGNSLFATNNALDGLNRADLANHAQKYFTTDRISVVGSGVEHSELKALVETALQNIVISQAATKDSQSIYYGGEARIEAGPSSNAIYAVAYPGTPYSSSDYSASLVLKALLDGSKRVKWGSSYAGALGAASTESTSSTVFAHSYSDSGLIGFVVEGSTDEVKDVVKKSISAFVQLATSVSPEALEIAKKSALLDAQSSMTRSSVMDSLGKESTAGGVAALTDVSSIESVTAADILKLAKAAISAKPSIVAHGNLLRLPYATDF